MIIEGEEMTAEQEIDLPRWLIKRAELARGADACKRKAVAKGKDNR